MATLAAPKSISPLIRFCRYTALVSGIGYGHFRMKYLKNKEVTIQEHEDKLRAIRDARLKKELEMRIAVELNTIAVQVGIEPKPLPT